MARTSTVPTYGFRSLTAIMASMERMSLDRMAALLRERNAIDEEIAGIMGRPMASGHLGEWIASQVFDIELEVSAVNVASDGRFRSGPLQGHSVNVKWYLKREGLLDTSECKSLDYYLVLAGPLALAGSSRGCTRPWCIQSVFLFDARQLHAQQANRGVRHGVASSVLKQQWTDAEIYPTANNPLLAVTPSQAEKLHLFQP
jgi:hypothetical protein